MKPKKPAGIPIVAKDAPDEKGRRDYEAMRGAVAALVAESPTRPR